MSFFAGFSDAELWEVLRISQWIGLPILVERLTLANARLTAV